MLGLPPIKENYVKAIILLTYLDKEIDQREMAEIFQLITQFDFPRETRQALRAFIQEPKITIDDVLKQMN